jgi:hypothetical protein
VAAGAFVDMRTGVHPGTHNADPYDFIVYSTMDLGKRIHWVYWLPGETTAGLANRFQVKWVVDWDGVDYTYDWNTGNLVQDAPETGWVQPSSWEDYDDGEGATGVIGSFGFAWWATDNEAPPNDTDGNAFNEVNQDDIDALRDEVLLYQTYVRGLVRLRATPDDPWESSELLLAVVPSAAVHGDFEIVYGTHLSGDIDDLTQSDNEYVRGQSDYGLTAQEPNAVEVVIGFHTLAESASNLDVAFESRINNPNGMGKLRLRNWNSGDFEQVLAFPLGTTDGLIEVDGIGGENRVRASDGRIEVSLRCVVIATFTVTGFEGSFDGAWVTVE